MDRTGMPGVESAGGRDRTLDGDLPSELATNRGPAPRTNVFPDREPVQPSAPRGGVSSDGSGGLIESAPLPLRQAADQAQNVVGQAVTMAQDQANQRTSAQVDRLAQTLTFVSEAVSGMSQQLREKDETMAAEYADKAAQQVTHAAHYLRGRDLNALMYDAEHFARRQPALFVGGALALGMLAARFLKSSGSASAQSQPNWTPGPTTYPAYTGGMQPARPTQPTGYAPSITTDGQGTSY